MSSTTDTFTTAVCPVIRVTFSSLTKISKRQGGRRFNAASRLVAEIVEMAAERIGLGLTRSSFTAA